MAILFSFPAHAAEEKTIIHDPAEAALLEGRHLFTDVELATDGYSSFYINFGEAQISRTGDSFALTANHQCYQDHARSPIIVGGFVKISGAVTSIETDRFTINGLVEFSYEPYTGSSGKQPFSCKKQGQFVFSKKGHGKYWRLQNTQDLCDHDDPNAIYSFDIFTAPLRGAAPNKRCQEKPQD